MHQAQSYFDRYIRPSAPVKNQATTALTSTQATGLKRALANDAVDYSYSAVISIGDAVQGIERSLYTWATVKLYYGVFYLARALLAAHGTAIIYDGTKPWSCDAVPGAISTKLAGPTHKAVLSSFATKLPLNPIISQPINSMAALDWLMRRREEANYTCARFCEPNPPEHFRLIVSTGLRRSISAYMRDNTYLYAFDPQHAMLALPLEALKQVMKLFAANSLGRQIDAADLRYMASLYSDRSGPISELATMFKI